jgi:hypothetical protein
MRVFVYWNLHKGLWSVKAMEGESKGKVIARVAGLALKDAHFKVSRAGRERVIREQRKNVHAGVVGEWMEGEDFLGTEQVTYNPYKYTTFVLKNSPEEVIRYAPKVNFLADRRVFI